MTSAESGGGLATARVNSEQWSAGLIGDPDRAIVTRPYLAPGCRLCFPGLKAVIFVTGLCDEGCYYCPVSRERLGKDVFYVNEEPVKSIEEAVLEVARQGARGASLTGGDPLIAYPRTIELIKALKDNFGQSFHIHLYTSGRYATRAVLKELADAGLDEIRFHPVKPEYLKAIRYAKDAGLLVGIEIPIGPGLEEWARKVIEAGVRMGAEFVNLNELEFTAANARSLLARGVTEDPRRPFTARGSLRAALRILSWARESVRIPVHFCPASFKDSIQTRNRLRRTARLDSGWDEEPTSDGLLRRGDRLFYPTRSRMLVSQNSI